MFGNLLHYNPEQRQDAVDLVTASKVVPVVRAAILEAANEVAQQFGESVSPYAKEVAAEMIIKSLAEFLSLGSFDDEDCARPVMLNQEFALWWFGLTDDNTAEAEQGGAK